MPVTQISVLKGWSSEQKQAICRGIQSAVKDVLCIAHDNFYHRIVEFDRSHMLLPQGVSERQVLIELDLFAGRKEEIKRALFEQIEKNLLQHSIQPEDIMIIYREHPLESWYIRGRVGAEIARLNREQVQEKRPGESNVT
jgi:phenylpyruvate tautomerase PptA (4-oxalocrotonate tautomerase family)